MSRIAERFAALRTEGRGALVTYLQAYDPDPACSVAILRGLPGAGADLIEIGVPFTDPMAEYENVMSAPVDSASSAVRLSRYVSLSCVRS